MSATQSYPLSIIANDKCELNVILQDDLFKEKFSKLKSLTLTNIDVEAIYSIIFEKKAELYNSLERLTLLEMDRTADGGRFAIESKNQRCPWRRHRHRTAAAPPPPRR